MSIIKCIECGNLISDKSEFCIQCGCPTKYSLMNNNNNKVCKINNKVYDFSDIYDQMLEACENERPGYFCRIINEKTNLGLKSANKLYEIFEKSKSLPNEFYGEIHISKSKQNLNLPKCPYCNSTNIKKISTASKAGSAALFGIFAMGKINKQWHCNHCGSDF